MGNVTRLCYSLVDLNGTKHLLVTYIWTPGCSQSCCRGGLCPSRKNIFLILQCCVLGLNCGHSFTILTLISLLPSVCYFPSAGPVFKNLWLRRHHNPMIRQMPNFLGVSYSCTSLLYLKLSLLHYIPTLLSQLLYASLFGWEKYIRVLTFVDSYFLSTHPFHDIVQLLAFVQLYSFKSYLYIYNIYLYIGAEC